MTPPAASAAAWREILAGLNTAVLASVLALTHGLLAFAPLGAAAVGMGMAAALASSAVAGAAMALLGASRPIIGTTTASTALLTASLLAAAEPATTGAGMLLAMLLAALAAPLILLVALAGLGRVAGLMPAPVAIGLTNAVVVLVLLSQLPLALGARPGEAFPATLPQTAAPLIALVAVAAMLTPLPGLPAPVVALAASGGLHYLLTAGGIPAGPVVGVAPSPELLLAGLAAAYAAWRELAADDALATLLGPAALSLALLAILETLTATAVMRERTGRRADASRDLLGGAAAMLGGAVVGGVPGSTLTGTTVACLAWGGRGRLAMLTRAAATLLILLLASALAAALPFAALAGVLAGAVLRLFQWRPLLPGGRVGRARRAADAAIVLAVVACAVAFGLIVAVGAGVALSVVIFTASMAQSPVRRSTVNPVGRSRVRRPAATDRLLREAGDRIRLIELEGAIFFGSAEAVITHAERAWAEGAEVLILDLGRVTRIDQSGGQRLLEACRVLPGRVLLTPLHQGSRAAAELEALDLLGRVPPGAAMPTLADAVEAAEEMLLARLAPAEAGGAAPADALAALGLPAEVEAVLRPRMAEQAFAAGDVIARQGDAADAAYLLLEGQVLISLPPAAGRPATRLAVLAPGIIFGESALLGGARRTADVTARSAVRCLRIDRDAVEALRRETPDAAWHLMAAVARQLTAHVVAANATIDRLEG